MKNKIKLLCLELSIMINVLLSINLITRKPECDRVHLDEVDRTKNVVSDKDMARKIAETHLYRENPGLIGLSEETKYNIEVTFDEENYEWMVHFAVPAPEGTMVLDADRMAWIRRDNGMIAKLSR